MNFSALIISLPCHLELVEACPVGAYACEESCYDKVPLLCLIGHMGLYTGEEEGFCCEEIPHAHEPRNQRRCLFEMTGRRERMDARRLYSGYTERARTMLG